MIGRKMKVIRTVDKDGREIFTYVKNAAPRQAKNGRRRKRGETIRVTLKLPR
jgi:hypothetical protein